MCLRPLTINRYNPDGQYLYSDTVPCGKCFECLRAKQSGYRVRCYLEALKTFSLDFVTLTYSPTHVPIRMRERTLYPDGFSDYGPSFDIDLFQDTLNYRHDYVHRYKLVDGERVSDNSPSHVDECLDADEFGTSVIKDVELCASLRRSDVQKCFKRARQSYHRAFNMDVPAFRYLCVGEYGSKSSRPHYHILFFGVDKTFLYGFFCPDWYRHHGNTYEESVKCTTTDFSKICTYISKYVTKGNFDQPHVRSGCCEVPHIMVSSGLGDLDPKQVHRLKCQDLYSSLPRELDFEHDIFNDPYRKNEVFKHGYDTSNIFNFIIYKNYTDGNYFTPESVSALKKHFDESGYSAVLDNLILRSKVRIGDYCSKFPKFYKDKYFGTKLIQEDDNGKHYIKILYESSQTALKSYKILCYYALHFAELEELQKSFGFPDLLTAEFVSQNLRQLELQSREVSSYQSLKSFYQKSKFS